MALVVICPKQEGVTHQSRMETVLNKVLKGKEIIWITCVQQLKPMREKTVLFAVQLNETGLNLEYYAMLSWLRGSSRLLEDCTGGILVDGTGELYTKSTAAELALTLNGAGCHLIGRPLVEATGSLLNFRIQARNGNCTVEQAYEGAMRELVERLQKEKFPQKKEPNLLALHASSYHTSNTMTLWKKTKEALPNSFHITEIGLRNGTIYDCAACPYTTCLHFGEKGGCFYGGVMSDEVYPAIRKADGLIFMCPNYNDAISANLTACINRLTALFRQTRFYDKAVFAIVVSGYSGSDTVARQIISSLNMNKSFYLPAGGIWMETANAPGEVSHNQGLSQRLENFVHTITKTLQG